ncbi:MAG: tetratricopeptide repeat protein [Nevskiales bacterium]
MLGNPLGYSAVTCMVVMLGACASDGDLRGVESAEPAAPIYAPPPATQGKEEPLPAPRLPEESPADARKDSGPAVVALLDRADTESKAGKLDQAAASLERALNIEPRNPQLYRQLALLRLQQGQTEQAEGLAMKSNSVAGKDHTLQARNWRLIAEARRLRQDDFGAAEAERKAAALLRDPAAPVYRP